MHCRFVSHAVRDVLRAASASAASFRDIGKRCVTMAASIGEEEVKTDAAYAISLQSVRDAHTRIKPHTHCTPVMTCSTLSSMSGRELFFKFVPAGDAAGLWCHT